jgi:hypothetical protein
MNLNKLIFTENACYKAGRKIKVKGIMVHSTGANNPYLKSILPICRMTLFLNTICLNLG